MEGVGLSGDWDFLYQGKEFLDFNGANLYDFNTRSYDAYIGRFWQLDGANQFASGYIGMGNMPTVGVDPDGQFAWFIWAGAAVISGTGNLISNWSKVKDFKTGLAYFGSGAAGGLIAVTNPWAGGATTAGANAVIDAATGNIPKFENFWDVAKYAGGLALDGLGASGAGTLARTGLPRLASWFSPNAVATTVGNQGFQRVGQVGSALFELESTAEILVKPAIKGFGQNTLAQGIKQGLNFADDLGKGSYSVYQGFDRTTNAVKYTGITSRDPLVRFGEHWKSFGTGKELLDYDIVKGATNLTKSQARILEQGITNQYGLGKNGGQLLNKVNSIAPKNWLKFGIR